MIYIAPVLDFQHSCWQRCHAKTSPTNGDPNEKGEKTKKHLYMDYVIVWSLGAIVDAQFSERKKRQKVLEEEALGPHF